ncbi:CAP-Gly protein [Brenneria tiliae]|uniref:CAP-Gly protein n=1 Tax=Brenneria tiliae TaxID=2914984 RepID=A0ABT0MRT5_9GAMM|nr:CAP-Gly protein [Brenneria tiliae]MCL2892533.1 CAP-Gly protein [Brenneria tiliae]MCL2899577.1 CAP-Gly protein [Brenneria tiliae]MCL2903955.1 CAP-Gly protein [Brenneria tiliae]
MSVTNELHVAKKISWGSIIGGVITVLAVSLLLSTLGTSLGFSIVDPLSDDPVDGVGSTVLVWSAVSIIISLAVGAFIAGRLAAMDGLIHGFLVWATALIVAAILGSALLGGAVKATGSALGSVASLTGNVISGAGSAVGGGLQGMANIGGQAFDNLNLDTELQPEAMTDEVAAALRKSNIASLQPDFVQTQLQGAKKEIGEAVKALAINPNNSDAVIQTLTDKLKKRGEALTQDVDRDSLTRALAENTSMSQEEVNKTVDNLIAAKQKTAQLVEQRLNDVEAGIEQAKQQYAELKQAAREEAAVAASAVAHAALWSFFALLIGAIVSALAGLWGVKTCNRYFVR